MLKTVRYHAAGGVVVADGKMLLLDRPSRSEVRLPKGHIEEGETPATAALRETTEESGYADLVILAELPEQTVEFDYQDKHIIRTEHYFLMRTTSPRQLPRTPEDEVQFVIKWVELTEAEALLTYAAEKQTVRKALAVLGQIN